MPIALKAVRKGPARRLRRHSYERDPKLSYCESLSWIGVAVGTAHNRSADNPISDFKSGSRAFGLASQEEEQIERHSSRAFHDGRFADWPDRK
jgi:hypothetical protein